MVKKRNIIRFLVILSVLVSFFIYQRATTHYCTIPPSGKTNLILKEIKDEILDYYTLYGELPKDIKKLRNKSDAWGREFVYDIVKNEYVVLTSYGKDGKKDDIENADKTVVFCIPREITERVIEDVTLRLLAFYKENGCFPEKLEQLPVPANEQLNSPFTDGWGHNIEYRFETSIKVIVQGGSDENNIVRQEITPELWQEYSIPGMKAISEK